MYVVEYRKVPSNIFKYALLMCNLTTAFAVLGSTWKDVAGPGQPGGQRSVAIYTWVRDFILTATIITTLSLIVRIWLKADRGKSLRESLLFVLFKRVGCYPLVQILSRSGTLFTLYYVARGHAATGAETDFSGLCASITEPLAGLGGLVVFLLMQGGAWPSLKRMLLTFFCSCCGVVGVEAAEASHSMRDSIVLHAAKRESRRKRADSIVSTRTSAGAGAGAGARAGLHTGQSSADVRPSDISLHSVSSSFSGEKSMSSRDMGDGMGISGGDYSYSDDEDMDEGIADLNDDVENYDELDLVLEYQSRAEWLEAATLNKQQRAKADNNGSNFNENSNPLQKEVELKDI